MKTLVSLWKLSVIIAVMCHLIKWHPRAGAGKRGKDDNCNKMPEWTKRTTSISAIPPVPAVPFLIGLIRWPAYRLAQTWEQTELHLSISNAVRGWDPTGGYGYAGIEQQKSKGQYPSPLTIQCMMALRDANQPLEIEITNKRSLKMPRY